MLRRLLVAAGCLVVLGAFGCMGPLGPEECISITVSEGTKPYFSWDGGLAYRLIIDANGGAVWILRTPRRNGLESPLRYGDVPDSAEVVQHSTVTGPVNTGAYGQPLTPGIKYYVQVMRYGINAIGSTEFFVH